MEGFKRFYLIVIFNDNFQIGLNLLEDGLIVRSFRFESLDVFKEVGLVVINFIQLDTEATKNFLKPLEILSYLYHYKVVQPED